MLLVETLARCVGRNQVLLQLGRRRCSHLRARHLATAGESCCALESASRVVAKHDICPTDLGFLECPVVQSALRISSSLLRIGMLVDRLHKPDKRDKVAGGHPLTEEERFPEVRYSNSPVNGDSLAQCIAAAAATASEQLVLSKLDRLYLACGCMLTALYCSHCSKTDSSLQGR